MPDRMPEGMPDRMADRMPEGMPDKVPECLPEHMPEDLPDRMPDRMSEDMPEDMPDRVPEDMPEHTAEDMPGRMPDRMPEDMPDKMPEDMSDRMPEDLPVTKPIDVMVGITRSKVIFIFLLLANFQNLKHRTTHTGTTTRCRTQRRNQNDPSRTRRTHEVPFIAGRSHLHRKTQGFVLRLPPQNKAHATFMQPWPCVSQHHVANLHVSTHMATPDDNNHAAFPMRSATTDSRHA